MSLSQFDFDAPSEPPPQPVDDKKRAARHVNIITTLFFVVLIGGFGISIFNSYRANEAEEREQAAQRTAAKRNPRLISCGEIIKAYSENAFRAKHIFENKFFVVEGIIGSIDSALGSLFISLDDEGSELYCYFPNEAAQQLVGLSTGKRVSIFGKCDGMTLGIITMHECELFR